MLVKEMPRVESDPKTIVSLYKSCPLRVSLLGGDQDGETITVDSQKEKVQVGESFYSDSFAVDKNGNSIYFCSGGAGKMRRAWVDKLLETL